jgi:hypothetical protein
MYENMGVAREINTFRLMTDSVRDTEQNEEQGRGRAGVARERSVGDMSRGRDIRLGHPMGHVYVVLVECLGS